MKRSICNIGPVPFTKLTEHTKRENLNAMDSIQFTRPCSEGHQHLDIGCGPGNFLEDHLLPHLRPCKRVVGVDCSLEMLDYAKRHCRQPELAFEHLDIEHGDPRSVVDKYGQFDRAYAFLSFHFVKDLERAYMNVRKLLKDGGECLVVVFVRTPITDMWHKVFSMREWRPYMPDPSAVLSDRFLYNTPVPWDDVETRERRAVTAAGLEVVACHTYTSQWVYQTAEAYIDTYVPIFKLDEKLPRSKREAFLLECKAALHEISPMTPDGVHLPYNVLVAHSRKATSCTQPLY